MDRWCPCRYRWVMRIAVTIFLTDETIAPVRLARELEQRGFAGLYLPEHTHIPVSRDTPYPAGGELPREYARTLDPFVALRSEEHTSELQSQFHLVCRLLLEKKKKTKI